VDNTAIPRTQGTQRHGLAPAFRPLSQAQRQVRLALAPALPIAFRVERHADFSFITTGDDPTEEVFERRRTPVRRQEEALERSQDLA